MKRTCKNNHLARAPYSTRRHKRYHHTQKKSGGELPDREAYFKNDVYSSIVALLDDKKNTDGHTLLNINENDWNHYDDIIIRMDKKKKRVDYVNKYHNPPFIYKKKKFKAIGDMKNQIEYEKCVFSLEHRLTLLANKIRNSNNEPENIKNILENNYYVYGDNIITLIKTDDQRKIWNRMNEFSILIVGLIKQKLVGTSDAEETRNQKIMQDINEWNAKYENASKFYTDRINELKEAEKRVHDLKSNLKTAELEGAMDIHSYRTLDTKKLQEELVMAKKKLSSITEKTVKRPTDQINLQKALPKAVKATKEGISAGVETAKTLMSDTKKALTNMNVQHWHNAIDTTSEDFTFGDEYISQVINDYCYPKLNYTQESIDKEGPFRETEKMNAKVLYKLINAKDKWERVLQKMENENVDVIYKVCKTWNNIIQHRSDETKEKEDLYTAIDGFKSYFKTYFNHEIDKNKKEIDIKTQVQNSANAPEENNKASSIPNISSNKDHETEIKVHSLQIEHYEKLIEYLKLPIQKSTIHFIFKEFDLTTGIGVELNNIDEMQKFIVKLFNIGELSEFEKIFYILRYYVIYVRNNEGEDDESKKKNKLGRDMIKFIRDQIIERKLFKDVVLKEYVGLSRTNELENLLKSYDVPDEEIVVSTADNSPVRSHIRQSLERFIFKNVEKIKHKYLSIKEPESNFDKNRLEKLFVLSSMYDNSHHDPTSFEKYIRTKHDNLINSLSKNDAEINHTNGNPDSDYLVMQSYLQKTFNTINADYTVLEKSDIQWFDISKDYVTIPMLNKEKDETTRNVNKKLYESISQTLYTLENLTKESAEQLIDKHRKTRARITSGIRRQSTQQRLKEEDTVLNNEIKEMIEIPKKSDALVEKYRHELNALESEKVNITTEIKEKKKSIRQKLVDIKTQTGEVLKAMDFLSFRRWQEFMRRDYFELNMKIFMTKKRILFEKSMKQNYINERVSRDIKTDYGSYDPVTSNYHAYANSGEVQHGEVIWTTLLNENTNAFEGDINKAKEVIQNNITKLILNTSLGLVNFTGREGKSWFNKHSISNSGLNYHKSKSFFASKNDDKVAKQKLGIVVQTFLNQRQSGGNWMYVVVLRGYDKVEGKNTRTYYINVLDYKSGNQKLYDPHFLISFACDSNNRGISAETMYQAMYASSPEHQDSKSKHTQKARISNSRGFLTRSKTKQNQIQAFKSYDSVNRILNELSKLNCLVHTNGPYKHMDPTSIQKNQNMLEEEGEMVDVLDIRKRLSSNVENVDEYMRKGNKDFQNNVQIKENVVERAAPMG